MSWEDAARWLERIGLTLPTEAQWERAARAETLVASEPRSADRAHSPWWCGATSNSIGDRAAGNLADTRSRRLRPETEWHYESWEDEWIHHAPVGSFRANQFGLHDTIGNVWEFCVDQYHSAGVREGVRASRDGAKQLGDLRSPVIRGGGFNLGAAACRSANRHEIPPNFVGSVVGVRPARTLSVD